ncbi:Alpha/Beta hydrolase protein [Halteromyces radiatus]|uniref:Alpha/Beta hydrolase protein n=1 Tax=Halteromyces radiatus TaxID=101107 RepID=UPI00221F2F04|nr:Alpha/Beta hydrolase protein [Halteromyces radiatus]KAI8089119.1 Alpha/Beta hydrolase protein [Halteromyces radiatus]
MMASYHPGVKTWLIALLTTFWAYRKTRNLAIDMIFKTIKGFLLCLPHKQRSQVVKYLLGRPTKSSRRLVHQTTLPHGSQWDHVASLAKSPLNATWVAGHWFAKDIQRKKHNSSYYRVHDYVENTINKTADLVLLYIHGGGFRVGSSTMYPDFFLRLMHRLEKVHDIHLTILSLEYDLAPEHDWHRMLDQANDAFRYLLSLGVHSSKIIIGGDSAGGHLTGMLLPRLIEQHQPVPLGGIMISPLVTFDHSSPSFTQHAAFDCLPDSMMKQDLTELFPELRKETWQQQLEQWSPLHVDSTGLPPMLVTYGQRERFANDVERYITRLTQQEVDVHVITRHNEPHVYVTSPLLASTKRAWANDCDKLADWCSQRIKQSDAY